MMERATILERLHDVTGEGQAILAAGCSAGIVAKCAEFGGADLIVVYSTGRSRLMGLPTWRLGNSNPETLAMSREILNVVNSTPVIGGVEACDPTRLDLEALIDDFIAAGFSGIINFPTLSNLPDMRRRGDAVGIGFEREVELIRRAHDREIFTMAYVASPEDSAAMGNAGVDCIVSHSGPTDGGVVGYPYNGQVDDALDSSEAIFRAARQENDHVVCLLHGGPLVTPTQVGRALQRTSAVGFVGASSIERIPIEQAVTQVSQAFKRLTIGPDVRQRSGPSSYSVTMKVSNIALARALYEDICGARISSGPTGTPEMMTIDFATDGGEEHEDRVSIRRHVRDLGTAERVLSDLGIEVAYGRTADGRRMLMLEELGGLELELVDTSEEGRALHASA